MKSTILLYLLIGFQISMCFASGDKPLLAKLTNRSGGGSGADTTSFAECIDFVGHYPPNGYYYDFDILTLIPIYYIGTNFKCELQLINASGIAISLLNPDSLLSFKTKTIYNFSIQDTSIFRVKFYSDSILTKLKLVFHILLPAANKSNNFHTFNYWSLAEEDTLDIGACNSWEEGRHSAPSIRSDRMKDDQLMSKSVLISSLKNGERVLTRFEVVRNGTDPLLAKQINVHFYDYSGREVFLQTKFQELPNGDISITIKRPGLDNYSLIGLVNVGSDLYSFKLL